MSFTNRLSLIPKPAFALALILFTIVVVALPIGLLQDGDRPPIPVLIIGVPIAGLIAATYILLIGYIYADARQRGMRHVMWTLLAIFIPNGIGIILYFLMRDPMPVPCPTCGTLLRRDWEFCPSCARPIGRICPACRRKVDLKWANCAHCGTRLNVPAPAPQ